MFYVEQKNVSKYKNNVKQNWQWGIIIIKATFSYVLQIVFKEKKEKIDRKN